MKTITVQVTQIGARAWTVRVNGKVVAECAVKVIAEKYVSVIKVVAQLCGAEVKEL